MIVQPLNLKNMNTTHTLTRSLYGRVKQKKMRQFEVSTIHRHIYERIAPEAIIHSIRRENPQIAIFAKPETPVRGLVEFYQYRRNNYEC